MYIIPEPNVCSSYESTLSDLVLRLNLGLKLN